MVKKMERVKKETYKFYKLLMETLSNPVMQILPGQVSFFFVLSIFPIILILGIIAPTFSISMNTIISAIKVSFPADTSKILIPLVSGKSFDKNIIILLVSSLYLISRGTKSIIIAASTVYGVNENNALKNFIKSIVVTVLLTIVFIFIAIILAYGNKILSFISIHIGLNDNIIDTYDKLKWPLSFFVVFFVVKIIYTLTPNVKINSKDVTLGAIITTVLWIVITAIYSYYITHFSSYNLFYGSTANMIILLLWIYLISYIFVFGMVINVTKSNYIKKL